jgi:capsular polysaccharide biosynthesis protein
MVGAVIAALIAIYLETSNKVISGEDDIKTNYDLSILGVVPDFHISAKGGK